MYVQIRSHTDCILYIIVRLLPLAAGQLPAPPAPFPFCGNFRRVLLAEQINLLFVLFFELFRLSRVDPFREFNAARLQRVKRPCADLLVKPHIAPEALPFALKLLFSFILCHPSQLPSFRF